MVEHRHSRVVRIIALFPGVKKPRAILGNRLAFRRELEIEMSIDGPPTAKRV